ncbi:MAG: TonB-dependent receptor [Bacteroidales bacterium]|nr:TonB-dependent receptor [Bacteroidales bacterium]
MGKRTFVCLAFLCAGINSMEAQEKPTIWRTDSVQHLQEVVVSAWKRSASIIPVQQLTGETLHRLSVHSVADALRYFSGVQIKDYGGIGGLKTVNVRSLGTNHTGVFYDGIELGNAQNGVVDLGRFSLDNMEAVQLYNGQKTNMLQSAKDYSSASAVYMQSRRPSFSPDNTDHLHITMKAGSFDTFNSSMLWEHKLSDSTSLQASAEYLSTSGRYKFHYAKKNGYDTTAVRQNGDVRAVRVENTIFKSIKQGEWLAKLYFYNSERGYPGAAVREEPGKFRHQDRQWDSSVFAQGSFRQRYGHCYNLLVSAKAAYDYLHYLSDPRLDVTTMYTDNHYRQTELYVSAAHRIDVTESFTISMANDLQYNHLDADLTDFVYPSRIIALSSLAGNLHLGRFDAQLSLLHTYVSDHTEKTGGLAGKKSKTTPTVAFNYSLLTEHDRRLTCRAFFKRIFRLPTFNDLYYTFIGNKDLKPEYTTQYDIGLNYSCCLDQGWLRKVEFQADGYYNKVEDKIVAMPTNNQFRWTMMNFGLCHILGLDASIKADWLVGGMELGTHASYTYNRAADHTDAASTFYGGQLPYIPWHSASAVVSVSWRHFTANYSFLYTGERYESSANIAENYSKPWYTSDFSLSRTIPLKAVTLRATAEVCNLFNQQYEVVQCYPMPGTNFKFKLKLII